MGTVVKNEEDLNTLLDEDLVTEDYALEILGLKNISDFRKFSRSFMKLSKIVKGIENSNNEKLDKGGYTGNAKNLNDEISKKASKKDLGRMQVGTGLKVEDGVVSLDTDTIPRVDIVNDFVTGGSDKSASAETVKTLNDTKLSNELLGSKQVNDVNTNTTDNKGITLKTINAHATNKPSVEGGLGLISLAETPNWYAQLAISWNTGKLFTRGSQGNNIINGEWIEMASLKMVNEKFKNFCPFRVGDIYITTNSTNPSSLFLGTTWQKLEGVVLRATTSGQSSKLIVGSDTVAIQKVNLPNIKLKVDPHSHPSSPHYHKLANTKRSDGSFISDNEYLNYQGPYNMWADYILGGSSDTPTVGRVGNSTEGSSGNASTTTETLGNNTPLNITPKSYTTHIWVRLT